MTIFVTYTPAEDTVRRWNATPSRQPGPFFLAKGQWATPAPLPRAVELTHLWVGFKAEGCEDCMDEVVRQARAAT